MLFRPPSTSEVEIWWVICSDSSLSSPLLITPSDISSHSAVHPPLDSECLLTLLLPSCPLLWIYLLLTPSPLPHFCHLPPFWFITSLSSSDSFRLCPSPPPSSLSTYVSLHLSFSTSPAPVICIPLSPPPPLLSPLISLVILYILVLSLPSTHRSSTAPMSGSAASSQ